MTHEMTRALTGRVVVVTGGFGAVGRALGAELLAAGARVALLDRSGAPATLADSDSTLLLGDVDLGMAGAPHAAMARVAERWQGIDALINVAGGFAWEPIAGGSLDTWDRMYAVNLRSAVAACQAALPHLLQRGAGRIVNVGAMSALKAGAGVGAYTAAKAGVMRLTEALAEELKDSRITVNSVLPAIVDTPANRADMPQADFSRWVSPAALARIVAFLLSDDAEPITGACLPVAGRA
jgi:NAD(P)-dependent dehydrogenase (short-subunit alcohol dehydrogenase family)